MIEAKLEDEKYQVDDRELRVISLKMDERTLTAFTLLCTTGMVNAVFTEMPPLPMEPGMLKDCLIVMGQLMEAVSPVFELPASETIKALLAKLEKEREQGSNTAN